MTVVVPAIVEEPVGRVEVECSVRVEMVEVVWTMVDEPDVVVRVKGQILVVV